MASLKCKMCGGSLEAAADARVGTCLYCGSQQTLPRINDDKKADLYDRADAFRRNNEYDKAFGLYQYILNEDKTDAEAYWSLILCKYGVEYVQDPASHKRIPICNRTQMKSVFLDEDYRQAMAFADEYARSIYELEAKAIESLQRDILRVSGKEEPYDVFLCYKETDSFGRRTRDSVLAQELYRQLVNEGFRVFFARITLEDKIGSAYEPYIFAALQSAKAMLVLGTSPEHFNAVWVKNEWSRYLALINEGAKKTLIPLYEGMEAYHLPEEFAHLQAQDMGKIGAVQDIIRAIHKICGSSVAAAVHPGASAKNAVIRGMNFLEDNDFQKAQEYFERALDADPHCSSAYLGNLLIKLNRKNVEELKHTAYDLSEMREFQRAVTYAGSDEQKALEDIRKSALQHLEICRLKSVLEQIADQNANLARNRQAHRLKSIQNQREEAAKKQRDIWAAKGLCRYCGGAIGGLFIKKCKACGAKVQ